MSSSYHHGIRIQEVNDGTRPMTAPSTAIIGLVATAADADDITFPLNTPVLITDVYRALGKAGTQGTLALSLEAIQAQCQPVIVVVRIDAGVSLTETYANVIGTVTNGDYSGLKALQMSAARTGVTPRIIVAPGLDDDASVAAALAATAKHLNGYAFAKAAGDTISEAILYRRQFAQRELELLWPEPMNLDPRSAVRIAMPVAAYAAGKRAEVDEIYGWHHAISNLPLNAVSGLSHDVSFSYTSESADVQILNEAGITTIKADNGYALFGMRSCSDDPLFAFQTTVRTAQVLKEMIASSLAWAIGKPMTVQLVRDIIASINNAFRELKAKGRIIGGQAWYEIEQNQAEGLKNGRLSIVYDYTPVYPLELLELQQKITDRYLTEFSVMLSQ